MLPNFTPILGELLFLIFGYLLYYIILYFILCYYVIYISYYMYCISCHIIFIIVLFVCVVAHIFGYIWIHMDTYGYICTLIYILYSCIHRRYSPCAWSTEPCWSMLVPSTKYIKIDKMQMTKVSRYLGLVWNWKVTLCKMWKGSTHGLQMLPLWDSQCPFWRKVTFFKGT